MKNDIWPDGNQCCVCLTFDLDAEWVFMGNDPKTANMPRRLSLGQYVWNANIITRILNVLDNYNVKATFFVPGINAANHPKAMKTIHSEGHEIACHGWKHENVSNLPREEEKKRLMQTIEAIETATGEKPIGNRAAGGELSPNTFHLLWENGFVYDSSLRGSDMPYQLKMSASEKKGLIIVPSYYEMDDFHLFADYPGTAYHGRILSPQTGFDIWTNAFDGYYKLGLCYTTMFHPQIIGKPGNIMLLERLMTYIKKFPNIWFATAKEIAKYWRDYK